MENENNNNNLENKEKNININNQNEILGNAAFINNYYLPNLLRLFGEVISSNFDNILNYLDLIDLCQLRTVSKGLLSNVNNYYPLRLKMEIDLINSYQNNNKEKIEKIMEIIDSQIPLSSNNWIDFNLTSVINKILNLDSDNLLKIKSIKNIGKNSDLIFAPFCILMNLNKNVDLNIKSFSWKYVAIRYLNTLNFQKEFKNFDIENIPENNILETIIYLNKPELNNNKVKFYSKDLNKLIIWCQAVVSYHILIHPYTLRNNNNEEFIKIDENIKYFTEQMCKLINRFYKFKRFLTNIKVVKIPLADFVFNLQHSRQNYVDKKSIVFGNLNSEQIGLILTFLPYSESYKFKNVCRKFKKGFLNSIDINIYDLLKDIYLFKYQMFKDSNYDKFNLIHEYNLFSKFFLMLESMLIENSNNLFTKDQLFSIRNIKKENPMINSISKIFCLITNLKPNKYSNENGQIFNEYFENIKTLIIKNELVKFIKFSDKLININKKNVKIITEELMKFYNMKILSEVKKFNKGIYQLLILIIGYFEFFKNYNPFEFIYDKDLIEENLNEKEKEMMEYNKNLMNYLKYHLKLKYYFSSKKNPFYNFLNYFTRFKQELINNNLFEKKLFKSSNENYESIANIYFENLNKIEHKNRPIFFEKIILEIINKNQKNILIEPKTSKSSSTQLIKEDNKNLKEITTKNHITYEILYNNNQIPKNYKQVYKFDNFNNKSKLKNKKLNENLIIKKVNKIDYNNIPNDLFIIKILFYLDIENLFNFNLINKKSNFCWKTHIFIRLHYLHNEKNNLIEENKEKLNFLLQKKYQFYKNYNIPIPNENHAKKLINQLTKSDINNLKVFFKKDNKNYENIIKPFILLLGAKEEIFYDSEGIKNISYFKSINKILKNQNLFHNIKTFDYSSISIQKFLKVDNILRNKQFKKENLIKFSNQIVHAVNWSKGIIEMFRLIRKYSINEIDVNFLNNDEIELCKKIDYAEFIYDALLKYTFTYCKKYEKNAQRIINVYFKVKK